MGPQCCLEEAGDLISPCECRGSSAFVHPGCLERWRETVDEAWKADYCTICQTKYVGVGAAKRRTKKSLFSMFGSAREPSPLSTPLRPGLVLTSEPAADLDSSSVWHECVVLVLAHSPDESVGVILNKPQPATDDDFALADRTARATRFESVQGGSAPWGDDAVFVLSRSRADAAALVQRSPGGVSSVADGLHLARMPAVPPPRRQSTFLGWARRRGKKKEEDAVPRRAAECANGADGADIDLRICHLTADWGPRQLEDECRAGQWRAHPGAAASSVVFRSSSGMWASLR